MHTEQLRKSVKIKLVELGFDKNGFQPVIARLLNVNPNSLSMALTGFRTGPAYQQILSDLLSLLSSDELALKIEKATGGEVTVLELLFPQKTPSNGVPHG